MNRRPFKPVLLVIETRWDNPTQYVNDIPMEEIDPPFVLIPFVAVLATTPAEKYLHGAN